MSSLATRSLGSLLADLADKTSRPQAVEILAQAIGVEAVVVLLRDDVLGTMRPAPGFPQTLPGGPGWQDVLKRAADPGEFLAEVAFPSRPRMQVARVVADHDGTAIVLVGGSPSVSLFDLAVAFKLPSALFRAEATTETARATVQASNDVVRRSTALAAALDLARAQVTTNAAALQHALKDSARLNHELSELNGTLERRVEEEIDSRLKAEDALRQAQKMEAIGQLTGGVAHDFNNLLTVIMGGLDTIDRQLEGMPDDARLARLRRSRDMAFLAAQRAATLTSRLLAFSRRQPLDPKPIDANRLVRGLSDLLQRTLGETVRFEAVSTPGLWLTQADPNELENALVNLAVNARDAMPGGGKLIIETGNTWLDEGYLATVAEPVPPGQYVLLAVSDTGYGMDDEILKRVFEPFFTTKEVGKGTGLGLSQVYGFVRQSEGHIRIYSEMGSGTTVKIYLPRLNQLATLPETGPRRPLETAPGGDETILVVEDHDDLRSYSVGVLRDLGYNVFEAPDGRSALAVIAANPEIDLLFTDIVLPEGMNGRELADAARVVVPSLRVLFTSGYTRNAIVHNGRLDSGVNLITKPFSYDQLAAKVRDVLEAFAG